VSCFPYDSHYDTHLFPLLSEQFSRLKRSLFCMTYQLNFKHIYLLFRWISGCKVLRSYFQYISKYNQQDTALHILFISVKCSTRFRRYLHPSSGAQKLYIQHRVLVKLWTYLNKLLIYIMDIKKCCDYPCLACRSIIFPSVFFWTFCMPLSQVSCVLNVPPILFYFY
jgi:hypothetical protein